MKKIIILTKEVNSSGAVVETFINFAFWFPVPVSLQPVLANPLASSSVRGILPTELAAIQSGQVVETVNRFLVPSGWTTSDIKTELITEYTQQAATLASTGTAPYVVYGASWDGTTWSA